MKKVIIIVAAAVVLASCSNSNEEVVNAVDTTNVVVDSNLVKIDTTVSTATVTVVDSTK